MFWRKKDPYHVFRKGKPGETKLQRAKRRNKMRTVGIWRQLDRERAEENKISEYLANDLCPKCEARVTSSIRDDPRNPMCGYTDFKCTACNFEKSYWWDDMDDHDG